MRLLLDEQISVKVAERLRARDHDVIAVTEDPTLRGMSDPELFAAAQVQERAIVTYNRDDFLALVDEYAQRGQAHNGVVIVNPRRIPSRDLSRLADSLDRFLKAFSPWPSFVTWLP